MIQNVDFKGIVRGTSAQNNADGNCEEIINLRKKMGAWRVVGEKKKIVEDVEYEQVFLHECDSFKNYIGVKKITETGQDPTGAPVIVIKNKVIWFDLQTKEEKQIIYSIDGGDIELEHLNNILLIKTPTTIGKAIFNDGKYTASLLQLPDCPEFTINTNSIPVESDKIDIYYKRNWAGNYDSITFLEANETIKSLYGKMIASNPKYTEGYVMISIAYKLYDGTVTKPCPPRLIYVGNETKPPELLTWEMEVKDDVTIMKDVSFEGSISELLISPYIAELSEEYKDIITGLVVYATIPIRYWDFDNMESQYLREFNGTGQSPIINENKDALSPKKLEFKDLEKQLFYEVASFNVSDGKKDIGTNRLVFDFKTINFNNIESNNTMPVDSSSYIDISGRMFIYNNRLHLFNLNYTFSKSAHWANRWNWDWNYKYNVEDIADAQEVEATVAVYLTGTDLVIKMPYILYFKKDADEAYFLQKYFAFPDSRAYRVEIFYRKDNINYLATLNLESSQAYNVSYYINHGGKVRAERTFKVIAENLSYKLNNNILVSGLSNPYNFPPEHAYLVSGSIINIAVSSEQISSSQIGQFPLYVFTTQGIYAMQLGEGEVLYSNLIPISAEVAVAGSSVLQTRYGIVFVTKTGLKLIAGREVVDISQAIAGNPDISMQECETFGRVSEVVRGYDIRPYFSSVPFQDYIKEASLGYDINENEIIVSNPNYSYSYVYNLDEKTWHKITEVFTFFDKHLALRKGEGNLDLCDIREEISSDRLVHLQTRPLLFNTAAFKQIYHAVARGEFKPAENRIHLAYMLASNDLSKWTCMAVRKTEINAPHISLPRAHQSFRYFSFIVGGYVRSGHLLTHAELEGEVKYGNRLR